MHVQKEIQRPACLVFISFALLLLQAVSVLAQSTWEWDASPGLSASFTSANATVYALQEFDDGSGPVLFAGGSFVMADLEAGTNIARWDRNGWIPAGDGLNGTVRHLHVHDAELYAGGEFTMSGDQ